MSISLGADPEWFLYRNGRESGIKPCVGKIPGTKEAVFDLGDGYGVHEDNVLIELTVPPTTTVSSFADSIIRGMGLIKDEFLDDTESLCIEPAFTFNPRQLQSTQAKAFGCEPDFDAYASGKQRHIRKEMLESTIRFAGGHIHIGGDFKCPTFVAALFADLFISLPSMYPQHTGYGTLNGSSFARKRLEWYGAPGVFRPKPYGFEYRTPSNFWTSSYDSCCSIGDKAMRLGHYLENTSATNLRSALKQVNWLQVQGILSKPPVGREEQQQIVGDALETIQQVVPL